MRTIVLALLMAATLAACSEKSTEVAAAPTKNDELGALTVLAERGDAHAQYVLGYGLLRAKWGGLVDDAGGKKWLHAAAEQKNVDAMMELYRAYAWGPRDGRDPQAAVRMLNAAVAAGHPRAYLRAGQALMAGEIVERNEREGIKWIQKAIDAGDVMAISIMGQALEEGKGVPRDINAAKKLYKMAIAKGDKEAEFSLSALEAQEAAK
jgi:uncharacterized protein